MKAFPELKAVDARCHSYDIHSKFAYKCMQCNHFYKRHSKSLDIDRKCCGRCRGKLELHQWDNKLEKYMKLTQVEGADANAKVPKTPNAFAAFVKENYKVCRTPGVKHADAMKQLSQMFKEAKIAN